MPALTEVKFTIDTVKNRESKGSTDPVKVFRTTLSDSTYIVDEATGTQLVTKQAITVCDFAKAPTFDVVTKTAGFLGTVDFVFTSVNRVPKDGKVIIELLASDDAGSNGFKTIGKDKDNNDVSPTVSAMTPANQFNTAASVTKSSSNHQVVLTLSLIHISEPTRPY